MLQSQQFSETNGLEVDDEEQFAAVLNAFLPEIERQLLKDIKQQLEAQFQQKFQNSIEQINSQALQQYQQAILQLEESRQMLQKQKQSQILNQIQSLQSAISQIEQQMLMKMQEKFLEEHFDTRVMTHPRIQQLQKEIEEQIYYALEEKHEATKQRQLKELIIAHQTREIKLRKELDQQIKSRIYCSSGLQELKQEIKQSKIQMGSQKSEYNLKLKKIETQIQEYQQKIKEYEKMLNLQMLREKYQQLQVDVIERETQKELQNDQRKRKDDSLQDGYKQNQLNSDNDRNWENDSLDGQNEQRNGREMTNFIHSREQFSHQRSHQKTLKRQQRNKLLTSGSQYPNDNQNFGNDNDYSESQNESNVPSQQNSKKFDFTAYFKGYLLNSQTAKIIESQDMAFEQNPGQKKSLLNLKNIGDLLKEKITLDPLEKYLNKQSLSKQNDMNSHNMNSIASQKTSNFAELYEQHLKKLNRGLGKKSAKNTSRNGSTEGLSEMAKKTIIKNISSHHKSTFCMTSKENQPNQVVNKNSLIHESYKTHESNLLTSYK